MNYLKSLFLFLILLYPIFNIHAQNKPMDQLTYAEIDSIVGVLYQMGDFQTAVLYMKQGMEKSQKELGEKDSIYAEYVGNVGFFLNQAGNKQEAKKYLDQAIDLKKKISGEFSQTYAESLSNLGSVYSDLGNLEEAAKYYSAGLKASKKATGGNDPNYASMLNNLGTVHETMGDYEAAEPLKLEALKIIKQTLGTNHFYYGHAISNVAHLYHAMGKYEASELLSLEEIEVKKKILGPNHPDYAAALNNLASLYFTMGKTESVEKLYLEARDIFKKNSATQAASYAKAVNNLATLYERTKNYELAEKLYIEAGQIEQKIYGEKHQTRAIQLNNLAHLYKEMKLYDKAEVLYLQSTNLRKELFGEQHPTYILALNNLSGLYEAANKLDTAFIYAMAAIAANSDSFQAVFPTMFSNPTNSITDAQNLLNCCEKLEPNDFLKISTLKFRHLIYLNGSFYQLLSVAKKRSEKIKNAGKDNALELQIYYNISKAVMQINEQVRNDFSNNESKLRILKDHTYFVKHGIDGAIELNKPIFLAEAFSFAEQNKSVLLTEAIKGSRAKVLGELPDSLVFQEIELQKKKDKLKKQKYEAKDEAQKLNILAQENKLNLEIDAFLKILKTKYPKYHALKYENITATIGDVQKLLSQNSSGGNDKTLFLEYFVTDSIVYLFALTKDKVELFPIAIGKEKFEKKVADLRKSLSDYTFVVEQEAISYQLYTQTAYWFYQTLVEPALKNRVGQIENLIIIADGALGHLPFESFLTKQAPQEQTSYKDLDYLVKNYNVSYNYSATLWKENKNAIQEGTKTKAAKQILACAATYTGVGMNIDSLQEPQKFALRKSLQPLPAALGEVDALEKIFQGDFLKGELVNEKFFKENASQYSVIHLAMHGLLHPRVPILSSLAFTENRDSIEDNFLQAFEIAHLKLNADLVVLSACETGFGAFEQGEGVISLARSFMYAGVPSLVVSLWQVNDHSTSFIMQYFYQYLAKGMAKDAALRQAKLDYIKMTDGIASHPAFWSAFIQLGDNCPIKIAGKTNWILWGILGAVCLAIVAVVIRKGKKEIV